ncbi:MAG: hypothetical protein H7A00_00735 [Hahellaceae bacterium]|nr:hypothetical protein [Hahellaceae bacterium]
MNFPKAVLLRALAVSLGALVAVFPLMIVRLLIVAAVEGAKLDVGAFTGIFYLPFEVLFPLAFSTLTLSRSACESALKLSSRVVIFSLLFEPFLVALFALSVYADVQEQQSFFGTLTLLAGMSPVLGVAGLIGFLFLCFPVIVIGWGVAFFADSMVVRKQAAALKSFKYHIELRRFLPDSGERWLLFWGRWIKRLSPEKPIVKRYQMALLKVELNSLRQPALLGIESLLSTTARLGNDAQRSLDTIREQTLLLDGKVLGFHRLLMKKLRVTELTFSRYSQGVLEIYQALIANLVKALALIPGEASHTRAVKQSDWDTYMARNCDVLAVLDQLIDEVGQLDDLGHLSVPDLSESLSHLKRLVAQVKDYQ